MDMIKEKWRIIAFGVVIAASAGLATWGVLYGDTSRKQMTVPQDMINKIKQYQGSGANPAMIDAKRKQIEKDKADAEAAIKWGMDLQRNNAFESETSSDGKITLKPREPLVPGALPKPTSEGVAFQFREQYGQEFKRIADRLHAGGPPTRDDIEGRRFELSNKKPERIKSDDPWGLFETVGTGPTPAQPRDSRKLSRPDVLRQDAEFLASLD